MPVTRPRERWAQSRVNIVTPGPESHHRMGGPCLIPSPQSQALLALKEKAPHCLFPRLLPRKTSGPLEMLQETIFLLEHHTKLRGTPLLAFPFSKPILIHRSVLTGLTVYLSPQRYLSHKYPRLVTGLCSSHLPWGTMPRD